MLIIAGTIRMKNPAELDAFVKDARATIPAARAADEIWHSLVMSMIMLRELR